MKSLATRVALWWTQLMCWLASMRQRVAQERFLMQVDEYEKEQAANALRKVINRRLFPPDCVSAGACRGGPALFFKHDGATEVFIGKNYDHAADKLLEWWFDEKCAGVAPITKQTTKMNRHERRAWGSGKRKDLKRARL